MKEKISAVKLLSYLLCFYVASVAVTVVDGLFYNDGWLQWIQRGITAGIIICLFFLGRENRLYRWAAGFRAAVFGLSLAKLLLFTLVSTLWQDRLEALQWIFTVLNGIDLAVSFAAVILEFLAHGKIAPDTRKGWIILLIANIVWGLLGNALSNILVQQSGGIAGAGYIAFLRAVSKGMYLVNLVFRLAYPCFLYRTIQAVKAKETE